MASEDVVVRLDTDLGAALVEEMAGSCLRPAPSIRGVDLTELGGIMLTVSGSTADLVTLLLAKEHITDFASRFAAKVWGSSSDSARDGRLHVELTSATGTMTVDLTTGEPSKLADALRALADVADKTV
jgi:hypothetical protein